MRADDEGTKKDGPCLAALRVFLGERGDRLNSTRCRRWLSSTRELRLVSLDLCNACRSTLPIRVLVGAQTPMSLWAIPSQQQDGGRGTSTPTPGLFGSGNSSYNMLPPLPLPPSPAHPRRRRLMRVRAIAVVWDRPARDISSAGELLEHVAHLKFGFHFDEPLVPACLPWPETLLTLDLGVKFHHDLSRVSFPRGLLELRFGATFNRCIQGIAWPPGLRKISLGPTFNKPITGVIWPASLRVLSFGDSFDQPLIQDTNDVNEDFWPPRLETLTFGTDFSHRVGVVAAGYGHSRGSFLPKCLKHLTLSKRFREPVDTVAWPPHLEELTLDCLYISAAGRGGSAPMCLPTGLKKLHMDLNFHQPIQDVIPLLPGTLEEIRFGDNFNQRLDGIKWSSSLKKLVLGTSFNQPIEHDHASFPYGLQELEFGSRFNQPIVAVAWPSSLRLLRFSDHFNQPILAVSWPEQLQVLHFGRTFDQPFSDCGQVVRWPRKLSKLRVGKNFKQPVERFSLPPGLLELELAEGCKQPLEGAKLPSRLTWVSVGAGGLAVLAGVGELMSPSGCRLRLK